MMKDFLRLSDYSMRKRMETSPEQESSNLICICCSSQRPMRTMVGVSMQDNAGQSPFISIRHQGQGKARFLSSSILATFKPRLWQTLANGLLMDTQRQVFVVAAFRTKSRKPCLPLRRKDAALL